MPWEWGIGIMADIVFRMMRRALTPALVFLLLAQAGAAAETGGKASGFSVPAVGGARLLTDQEYLPALLDGIAGARREIALSAFFFRTAGTTDSYPDVVLKQLLAASRRGIGIEAVLERGKEGDNVSRDNAATAARLRDGGIRVCMDAPERTTHAKVVVIDRRYLFVGSHNLTQSALKYNHEVSVLIDSPPLAEEAIRYLRSICP
ncbi:MAG: phospholipase [Proteobacteria bacterium]|nr:phospholipase [Pseudomonadota bacterium]